MTISDHESAGDRDDEDKEHEETKRLLYVALTRARDRLYLAGTMANGKLILQRGSIGRVLPASLTAAMRSRRPSGVAWPGAASTHALRRVPAPARAAARVAAGSDHARSDRPICDADSVEPLGSGADLHCVSRLGIPYNFVGSRSLAECH